MLTEIQEIPARAKAFLQSNGPYQLPFGVPYIGMGSSYFAPLAFKYMGFDIYPELASEYHHYLHTAKTADHAVLLSQSGKSTEVLWCASLFKKYTAISNDRQSPLCLLPAASQVVALLAGEEKYSSSKTYINTLLALFKGFGEDTHPAVELLALKMDEYDKKGADLANAVYPMLQQHQLCSLYITGSGPNIATAMQAALILSESTKLNFNGLPMAQYDHGPKETASNSVVIQVLSKGKAYTRSKQLAATVRAAGALVLEVEEPAAAEHRSVLHNIIPFNFMAWYLSQKLNIKDTFTVGGKVTEVNP